MSEKKNQLKTSLDSAQVFINWMFRKHPKIVNEYFNSDVYKTLNKTNLKSSVIEAMILIDK